METLKNTFNVLNYDEVLKGTKKENYAKGKIISITKYKSMKYYYGLVILNNGEKLVSSVAPIFDIK